MVPQLSALSLALCHEVLVDGGNHKNHIIYSIQMICSYIFDTEKGSRSLDIFFGSKCITNDIYQSIMGFGALPTLAYPYHLRSKLAFRSFATLNHEQSALA